MPHLLDMSFMKWAHEQMTHARIERYADDEAYYNGGQELVDVATIPQYILDALGSQYGSQVNMAQTIVNAYVSAISTNPITVEVFDTVESLDSDKNVIKSNNAKKAELELQDLYKRSRLSVNGRNFIKAARILGKKGGVAFKLMRKVDDGPLFIKVLRPDIISPRWMEEDQESFEYIAIINTFVKNSTGDTFKRAQVFYVDGSIGIFETMGKVSATFVKENGQVETISIDNWIVVEEFPNDLAIDPGNDNDLNIPIQWVENFVDDHHFSFSDIEPHKDLIDLINKTLTDLALMSHKAGNKRVIATGDIDAKAVKDNPISKTPGGFELITGDIKINVIDEDNISGLIDLWKGLVAQLALNTGVKDIAPEVIQGQSPSGKFFQLIMRRFTSRVIEKIKGINDALESLNEIWLKANKFEGLSTRTTIVPELPDDFKENAEIAMMLVESKLWARDRGQRKVGVEDTELEDNKIKKDDEERGDDFERRLSNEINQN